MTALLVALGAAVGAPTRYVAGHFLDGHSLDDRFPRGTLLMNVVGSFLLGVFSALSLTGDQLALLGTGFCGALTTYSAFAVKTTELGLRRGSLYALSTVLLALGACFLGFELGG